MKVRDRLLQADPAFQSGTFIKGQVRFISHSIIDGGIDDLPVKLKNRVFFPQQMRWYFINLRIKPDT